MGSRKSRNTPEVFHTWEASPERVGRYDTLGTYLGRAAAWCAGIATEAPPGRVIVKVDILLKEEDLFPMPSTEMAGVRPRPGTGGGTNWGHVGAGAAAGFLLPGFLGFGGGGAAATPVGELVSLLPLVLLGGGALYAFSILRK